MRTGITASSPGIAGGIGTTWVDIPGVPNATYSGVGANGTTVIAVSDAGHIYRSTDSGTTFSDVTPADLNGWKGVTYGNSRWVVTANTGNGNRVIYSTDDGQTWVAVALGAIVSYKVKYGAGLFVLTDDRTGKHPWWSTDATSWTEGTGDSGFTLGLTFDGTNFITGNDGSNSKTSPDGKVWTNHTTPHSANSAYGLANYAGTVVSVMDSGFSNYSTNNGTSWTAGGTGLEANTYTGVDVATNGTFFTVSVDGTHRSANSTDGINWTVMTMPGTSAWEDICPVGVHMIAVANNGKMAKI